ncbi:MAG: CHAT domain-containing protein [Planctomycetaceae bacterium]
MDGKPSRRRGIVRAAVAAVAAGCAVAWGQVVVPPTVGVPSGIGVRPTAAYDAGLAELAEGDVARALEVATDEYAGCTKFGNQRWIDTIAGAALVGECHFESGDFARAIAAYDEALAVAAQHPEWLLAVQFPVQPPRAAGAGRVATWGRSARNTSPAQLPDVVTIRMQGPDPQDVLQRGGVLAAPFDLQVRPQAIMQALVMAIYRRAEILGQLGAEAATVEGAARTLARRPAPPNHWSQSWIDVALGTALWAQGKPDQAAPLLERGLTIGRGLDHALTPWGLIVLGRIALDADRAAAAAAQFEEATYAAAEFGDTRALEEAFRLAFTARMLAGDRGVPATIRAAGDAIGPGDGLDVLRARLFAMRAEALAAAGDARGAAAALRDIDPRLLRGEPGQAAVGAEAAYAEALAGLAAGDVAAGDADLGRALGLARARSVRLFQLSRLVDLVGAGARIADRQAEALFARYLGPPSPRDFGVDPLGTLAVISAPRQEAFDAWIAVAARRGVERASDAVLDPAEAARRDRWLAARPLGGRLVSAERLLAADPGGLDPGTAARRAAIVAARPELGPLLDRLAKHRADLAAAALAAGRPADGAAARTPPGAANTWAGYRGLAEGLARHVAVLAAGRDAVTIDFPPLTPAAEIRRRLAPRQLILSFHWTGQGLTGVLESRDRFVTWDVRQAASLPAEIAQLARGLCLFDAHGPVGTDRLLASDWRGPAGRIERTLFENSRVALAEGIDELVIVPDGWLWYVPFELLPVTSARADATGGPRLLGEVCRVRYCPTRSLAVMGFEAPRPTGPVGIHAARMARGDDAAATAAVLARATAAIDRAVPVVMPAAGPPGALVASVFDALMMFDESGEAGAAATLVPAAAGRGGLTFADWIAPPPKRARVVVVPGLQTALADGLKEKSLPSRPGDDVFLPATDLLAAGAHTAVVSRWRVGGGTCVDLMTEFVREATAPAADPPEPASALWRRAVDLVTAECPDLAHEPRLRQIGDAALADARHPFLWAGYALVDCGAGIVPPAAAAPAAPAAPAAAAAAPGPAAAVGPAPPAVRAPAPGGGP